MVFSYYIIKYPYKLFWNVAKFFRKNVKLAVYIGMPMDYIILKSVLKHFPKIKYIAKDNKTLEFLKNEGIKNVSKLAFPQAVIMCRHSTYRFPEEKIIKIGFRHGAYHFKAFIGADDYNAFDLFFLTSPREVEIAEKLGIKSAVSGGFPKLDPAFDGSISESYLNHFKQIAGIDNSKKTLIFSSTWDGSGMSAIHKWAENLHLLINDYNILVTLHPQVSQKYYDIISSLQGIYIIKTNDVLPFLMIADVMIGDISSIIAEFSALDKPLITFRVNTGKRIVPEVVEIVSDISVQIDEFSELKPAIERCLTNPYEKHKSRHCANNIMFDKLDGKSGERASQVIKTYLEKKGISI